MNKYVNKADISKESGSSYPTGIENPMGINKASKHDTDDNREFDLSMINTEGKKIYANYMATEIAARTGIRVAIAFRVIFYEISLMQAWEDDETMMEMPVSQLAKFISSRTGIYQSIVLCVLNAEDEIMDSDEDDDDNEEDEEADGEDADDDPKEETAGKMPTDDANSKGNDISMSQMVEILHKRTGICRDVIDFIIQMEDKVFEERGISCAYCCDEE